MASLVYNRGLAQICAGSIDWANDTIKVMFVTSSYVVNADHEYVEEAADDANQHEISGVSGYTGGFGGAGRKTLASASVAEDDATDHIKFDAADFTGGTTWSSLGAGATIAAAIIIKEITNDGASVLIAYLDTNDVPTNGSDVDLTFDASGVFYLDTTP